MDAIKQILIYCAIIFFSPQIFSQEICDNGIDDDGNGLIDLNDLAGCPCALDPAPPNILPNPSFEQTSLEVYPTSGTAKTVMSLVIELTHPESFSIDSWTV